MYEDCQTNTTTRVSWCETALEWQKRSKRKRALEEIPNSPSSTAWAFFRPAVMGTGIAFLDAALRRQTPDQLPVVELTGDLGKTWSLLTLAARFVVATRPSQFVNVTDETASLPRVIVFDSTSDLSTSKLTYVVRSTLLRVSTSDKESFQRDMECCLGRLHIASLYGLTESVPILETLRAWLASSAPEHPTLVLWDGFLDDSYDESSHAEVIRQLGRVLHDCTVVFVSTSNDRSCNSKYDWDKFVTHRLCLERDTTSADGQACTVTVFGSRIPFSISLAGILS
jgi:hypothetical protein